VAEPADDQILATMTGERRQFPIQTRSAESNSAGRISDGDTGVSRRIANPDDPPGTCCDRSSALAAAQPIRSVIVITASRWSAALEALDREGDRRALDRRQESNNPGHIAWLHDPPGDPAHPALCRPATCLLVAMTVAAIELQIIATRRTPAPRWKPAVLSTTAGSCHPDSFRPRGFRTLRSVGSFTARRRALDQTARPGQEPGVAQRSLPPPAPNTGGE
jgi:hypothetical protein